MSWVGRNSLSKLGCRVSAIVLGLGLCSSAAVQAANFAVTTTDDHYDGVCDTDCTLREALAEANSLAGPDTIALVSGTYTLSIGGPDDDAGLVGDLDILDGVAIDATAGGIRIDGSAFSQVFHVDRGHTASIDGAALDGRVMDFFGGGSGGGLDLASGEVTLVGERVAGDFEYRDGASGVEVTVVLGSLLFGLNEGTPSELGVALTGVTGAALDTASGSAGVLQASGNLTGVPDLTLSGSFQYVFNDTGAAVSETIGGVVISFPDGSSIRRAEGAGATLEVLGLAIVGDLTFQQLDLGGSLAVGVTFDASLGLGDGVLTGTLLGSGLLFDNGDFGLQVPIALATPPAFSFAGSAELQINSGSNFLSETFDLGGGPETLDLPGGPFFRIGLAASSLAMAAGPSLAGNFLLHDIDLGASHGVTVDVSDGTAAILPSQIEVVDAQGTGLLLDTGELAMELPATLSVPAPGLSFVGPPTLKLNTSAVAVNAMFDPGTGTVTIDVPAGPFLRAEVNSGTLSLPGGTNLDGAFSFEQLDLGGALAVAVGVTSGALAMGSGVLLAENIDTTGLLLDASGAFALQLPVTTSLLAPGVLLLGTPPTLEINTGALPVQESFSYLGQSLMLALAAGPYERLVASEATLEVLGLAIDGDLTFQQTDLGGSLAVGVTFDASLGLGDGVVTGTLLGSGLLFDNGDFGLQVPIALATPPAFSFVGSAELQINSGSNFLSETFDLGGGPETLDLPGGPFFQIGLSASSLAMAAGPSLAGNFLLHDIDLGASHGVTMDVSDGTAAILPSQIEVVDAQGTGLLLDTGELAMELPAALSVVATNVAFSGTPTLQINTSEVAVNAMFDPGTGPVTIDVPAGPFLRALATTASLGLTGSPTIDGDVILEGITPAAGPAAAVTEQGAILELGGGAMTASPIDGTGLLLGSDQLALSIATSVSFLSPDLSLSGTAAVELISTASGISESFDYGGQTLGVTLPGGPFLRIAAIDAQLDVVGVGSYVGDFYFSESMYLGQPIVRVQGENVVTLSGSPVLNGGPLDGLLFADGSFSFTDPTQPLPATGPLGISTLAIGLLLLGTRLVKRRSAAARTS